MGARRQASFCLFSVALCLSLAGCRSRCDLVEAELRTKDQTLREIREELFRSKAYNNALQNELAIVRQGTSYSLTPEQASQTYTLRSITLGRGTGGYDDDDQPGDEALQVVVEPHDPDGSVIKAPGTLRVQALEITEKGAKRPISTWLVTPDELRRSWRSGLLSTGYSLVLPWKTWPASEKVRVVVQLMLDDGRVYEAEKDVTVRLAPKALRRIDPSGSQELPLPPLRKVEPMSGGTTTSTSAKPASIPEVAPPPVQILRPVPLRNGL